MGDWMGPRKVLMRIVIWWSAFTAVTGFMWNFTSMWVARFLFGAGEAGCFPNLTKASAPGSRRTSACARRASCGRSRAGAARSLLRWSSLISALHVLALGICVFGALGVDLGSVLLCWFRDNPRDHKSVNAAELALLAENEKLADPDMAMFRGAS